MYDPQLVQPMRDELTALGVQELITPDDVDGAMRQLGTTLVFVNSVCGCAAAPVRPAPLDDGREEADRFVTVFAGMETDATGARGVLQAYRPSSPQIALMKDGQLVKMIQRQDIEGHTPDSVGRALQEAYDANC